jgi:hypothetical protein
MSRTSKALIQVCHGWARSRSREFGVCVPYTNSEICSEKNLRKVFTPSNPRNSAHTEPLDL